MKFKKQSIGLCYVVGYCLISSAVDVFLSHILQSINLYTLIFLSFSLTWFGFFIITIAFFSVSFKDLINSYKSILLLNISTLVAWLGLFLGLKWTEASILVATLFGLSPIISVFIEIYKKNNIKLKDVIVSVLLTLIVIFLIFLAEHSQRNFPFNFKSYFIIIYTLLCIFTSLCMSISTYISKDLSNKGFNAFNIQSFRFPLLVFVCYFLIPRNGLLENIPSEFWIYLPIIVILGNIIPLWMLQKGIELSSVLSITIVINISPCITFALELLDPNLQFNFYKLVILIMLFLIMLISNDSIIKYFSSKFGWMFK